MAPELWLRRLTLALLALAATAVEIAAADTKPVLPALLVAFGYSAAMLGLSYVLRPPADAGSCPPAWVLLLGLLAGLAPFGVEAGWRAWYFEGQALELRMVLGLRNLGLVLAACGGWWLCVRTAVGVSLFLMLFAAAMTNHPAVFGLLSVYTAVGSAWLMVGYWSGLSGALVAAGRVMPIEVVARERLPWLRLGGVGLLLGAAVGVILAGPQRTATTLGEWFGTSGGTGDYDPFARGGVNDGDEETKGLNAKTTGMTQTDTFLDSPLPSLYDLFNEQFGEPFKPKLTERAIALTPQDKVLSTGKRPADNRRPSREFPAVRRSPTKPRDPASRRARALYEIVGRTPLHLRVVAYDDFDGHAWTEAPFTSGGCLIQKEAHSRWMNLAERTAWPIFAETTAHQIKVAEAPGSALIPTPAHTIRFRIGRVDQANFFAWGQERILKFAQRTTPASIVIETEARTVDPGRLAQARFAVSLNPDDARDDLAALAHDWTRECPAGWSQIAAIITRLRRDYTHAPQASTVTDATDVVREFVFRQRRGPAYQFAGAATLLLRRLGYTTRLVSGFYAHPDRYDPLTQHTPVRADDLHFWSEVQLSNGDWLILEPTPGYEVLGPSLSWVDRWYYALCAVGEWLYDHRLTLATMALVAYAGWAWRWHWLDAFAVGWWRWRRRDWRTQVRSAIRVLEQRARWAGQARPDGMTPAAWLRRHQLTELAVWGEWAAYAPLTAIRPPAPPAQQVCAQALTEWPLHRWQRGEKE
jgi:hypothetical protein